MLTTSSPRALVIPRERGGYHGGHDGRSRCSASLPRGAQCSGVVVCLAAAPVSALWGVGSLAAGPAVVASRWASSGCVGAGWTSASVGAAPATAGALRHPTGAALCALWRCPAHDARPCALAAGGVGGSHASRGHRNQWCETGHWTP